MRNGFLGQTSVAVQVSHLVEGHDVVGVQRQCGAEMRLGLGEGGCRGLLDFRKERAHALEIRQGIAVAVDFVPAAVSRRRR